MRSNDSHLGDRHVRRVSEPENAGTATHGILLSCVMTLLALLFIAVPAWILSRRRSRRRRRIQDSEAPTQAADKSIESERRYATIEAWLVNKQVLSHDEHCDVALQWKTVQNAGYTEKKSVMHVADSSRCLDARESVVEDESLDQVEGERECPICFDRFQVGEIVSWSPNPKCDHVFHHHCIKEWLQNRKDCPFCREMFLPVDKVMGEITINAIPELILGQKRRNVPCFYCLEHLVVYVPKATLLEQQPNVTETVRHGLLERSTASPDRTVLSSLRGSGCPVNHLSTDAMGVSRSGDDDNRQEASETCLLESDGSVEPAPMNMRTSHADVGVPNLAIGDEALVVARPE